MYCSSFYAHAKVCAIETGRRYMVAFASDISGLSVELLILLPFLDFLVASFYCTVESLISQK